LAEVKGDDLVAMQDATMLLLLLDLDLLH
jgi:hypothetical protein